MKYSHSKFKSNSRYLDSISIEYKKALITIENEIQMKKTSFVKEEGGYYYLTNEKIISYKFFKQHVDQVLERLDPVDKEFIENEYFKESKPMWWANCYSKSSYYRNKKKALEKFLQYYKL